MFYVYSHVKKTDGKCFYIGKGKGRRAWKKQNRNKYWDNIVNKYGFEVIILINNIDEEKALELEKLIIKQIGRKNLCNFTDGGEGTSGFNFSEESKLKKSKLMLGNKYKKGIKESLESRLKKSKSLLGKPSHFKGKKHSNEARNKMKLAKLGKKLPLEWKNNIIKSRSNSIICLEDNVSFNSIKEAGLKLNISDRIIHEVCKGNRRTAKGLTFKYIKCLQ